jgi:plasmid stabilization system protein ParE
VTRTLRVHTDASEELAEAVQWYEARRRGLGRELFDAVVASVESLQETPEMGAPLSADRRTRRFLLPRFPYHIVYRLTSSEIIVVAVSHTKRRPGYWRRRR